MQSKTNLFFTILLLSALLTNIHEVYGRDAITRLNNKMCSEFWLQEDQMRICYFRLEELYDKLKQKKDIDRTLELLKEELETRVEDKRKEIVKWNDQWTSYGTLLPSEQAKYEQQAFIKQQEFEELLQQTELEFQSKEAELMMKLTKEIERTAQEYAIANGFDFVLSYEIAGIYYGADKYDVTDNLLKILNDNYKP